MAVNNSLIITEKFPSRTTALGRDVRVEMYFEISGTTSEIDARDTLLANSACPGTYNAGTITGVNGGNAITLQMTNLELKECMPGAWFATVTYGVYQLKKFPLTGEKYYNFETGGGTQHVMFGYSSTCYPASGQPTVDAKAAINVSGWPPEVHGTDIVVPVFHWSETWYMSAASVTPAYQGALCRATGKLNIANFKGFAPGECLFLGASGSQRSGQGSYGNVSVADDYEISFRFASSPTISNLAICGGAITITTAGGWDYIWVQTQPSSDGRLPVPTAAHVVKVYQQTDFTALGIGT
jgi:hypothetical protein